MKYLTTIWTSIALCIALLGVRILDPSIVEQTRLNIFDQYIKSLPDKESEVIMLSIDEESLEKLGQHPFPRHTYAQMIADLRNSNAGIISFTLMFPEPDRFGGDEVFASWIKDNGIVLSQQADSRGRSDAAPYVGTATLGEGDAYDFVPKYNGLITNISDLESKAWGVGLINGKQEIDNITRRIPLLSQVNGQLYPSMPLEIIRVLQDKKSYSLKVDYDGIKNVMIPPYEPIKTEYDSSIWLNTNYVHEEYVYGNELPDLGGKTVIVGLSASGLSAQISTPQGLHPAHHLQASALQTVMDGSSISRPGWADLAEVMVILIGSLLILISIYYSRVWVGLGVFFVAVVGSITASYIAWTGSSILLDLTYPIIVYILTFASASFNNFYKQFKLRQQIKGQFGTYVSPDLVNQLVKNPDMMKLGGERKEMTFLFMDICGFTPISEHYKNNDDPEGLVELVNEFLDKMTKIILRNGGTIDKFMGDCIMAFWNAPLPCHNHAEMAVKSAIEIEEEVNELKTIYKERGLPDIRVGTGINTGDCIVGNMGSESRFDYSVIGDAVNLAARLEATASRGDYIEYPTIISKATTDKIGAGFSFSDIGDIKVKGKEEKIRIYAPRKLY
tara:strand:- start:1960 stop:3807 length:1848 start_codon:yes stop_codon:yes gene_type:complete